MRERQREIEIERQRERERARVTPLTVAVRLIVAGLGCLRVYRGTSLIRKTAPLGPPFGPRHNPAEGS